MSESEFVFGEIGQTVWVVETNGNRTCGIFEGMVGCDTYVSLKDVKRWNSGNPEPYYFGRDVLTRALINVNFISSIFFKE